MESFLTSTLFLDFVEGDNEFPKTLSGYSPHTKTLHVVVVELLADAIFNNLIAMTVHNQH